MKTVQAAWNAAAPEVGRLEHHEEVRLDPCCLSALYRDLGPLAAETVLTRAMSEIAARLEGLTEPHRSGRWAELARRARALSAIAEQVGMASVARVARSVADCAASGDAAGIGATLARLDRIASRSLDAIWAVTGTGD